jgi:hypothetical protein
LKIFARAADADHAQRLQNTLNVAAMVPILPEDNMLLTLPFGGAVMKALGVPMEEVNAIVESRRKEVLSSRGFDREEEELALLQLGISSKRANSTVSTVAEGDSSKRSGGDGKKETNSDSSRTEAAAERRKEAVKKSPFVAEVIQDVCPGSADDDESCLTPEEAASLIDVEDDMETKVDQDMAATMGNRTSVPEVVAIDDE